jgi:hypothetical protein
MGRRTPGENRKPVISYYDPSIGKCEHRARAFTYEGDYDLGITVACQAGFSDSFGNTGGIYMAAQPETKVGFLLLAGFLLVAAGAVIGTGVGQAISALAGKSVEGPSQIIGVGLGLLAAVVYAMMRKK